MVDAGGVVIWLGSAREDLVRGTVSYATVERGHSNRALHGILRVAATLATRTKILVRPTGRTDTSEEKPQICFVSHQCDSGECLAWWGVE